MRTSRLEAFSDGVFAIAATLLVLELRVPADTTDLGGALLRLWPAYAAYLVSFVTIGIIWVNHHTLLEHCRRVDRRFLYLNLLLLVAVGIVPFPTSLVDRYTSLHATIGTLAALRHRDRTGEGQVVDCCLLDSGFTMVEIPLSYYLATGQEGGEAGRPPYKAKDGYVVISASGRAMASRLIQIATGDANAKAEGYTSRVGQDDPRKVAVAKWCEQNTVDHIVSTLVAAEIPAAPVKTIPQAAEDPHLWEREMLVKMPDAVAGEMYLPGATIKMSKTPGRVGHVPTPGEHTDEILSSLLGYDSATLKELREAKVIA